MVGSVLKAASVGTEEFFGTFWCILASFIQVLFRQGTKQRDRRGTPPSAFLEYAIESGKALDIAADVFSVKDFFPIGQWVCLTEHKVLDDERFDVREMAEYPQCVTTASGSREYDTVFSHLLDF